MKKFYKSSLITAGILFATGSIILIICTFAGGSSFYHNIRSGNIPGIVSQLSAANLDTDDSAFHINDRIVHCNFNKNYPVYSGSRTDKEAADAGKVQKINIDLGGGEFMIEKSSDQNCFEVVAEGKDKYQYYTEEGTLYIIGFDGSNINFGDRHNKLTLRIPANLKFADVYVSLGAGNIKWDYLTTDSITIDAGAGSITMTDVSAASANVDLGAGSIEFYDSTLQDASFEVGLGTLDYSGVIRGDLLMSAWAASPSVIVNTRVWLMNRQLTMKPPVIMIFHAPWEISRSLLKIKRGQWLLFPANYLHF